MVPMIYDLALSQETIKETRQWINERPEVIRNLLVMFPPGCLVQIHPAAPICESHKQLRFQTWMVATYQEEGFIGLSSTGECKAEYHVEPQHLELHAYRNGIDRAFVESCF